MDMKTIRQTAREKLKGFCRVCPECNGKACAGEYLVWEDWGPQPRLKIM